MSKGTSIKEALALWSKENEKPAAEAEFIQLICQLPPIDKMDTA
jgi:dynein light chain 1